MVSRHATALTPAVIADLDGTLIRGNSLHEYIHLGARHLLRRLRLGRLVALLAVMGARRLHLVSHLAMKRRAAALIGWDPQLMQALGQRLRSLLAPDVGALIAAYTERGARLLVATASYRPIAETVVQGALVASPLVGAECRGQLKAERVAEWLASHQCSAEAVITDHHDDLPLLRLAGARERILVRPDSTTMRQVRAAGIHIDRIINSQSNDCL